MIVIVVLPFSVFGYAMWNNYKNKKNSNQKLSKYETLQYVVMLLAFAGGTSERIACYNNHVNLCDPKGWECGDHEKIFEKII